MNQDVNNEDDFGMSEQLDSKCARCRAEVERVTIEGYKRARKWGERFQQFWFKHPGIIASVLTIVLCILLVWTLTVWQNAQARMITATQAAARLGISTGAVHRLLQEHQLPGQKDAQGRWWMRVEDVKQYQERLESLQIGGD